MHIIGVMVVKGALPRLKLFFCYRHSDLGVCHEPLFILVFVLFQIGCVTHYSSLESEDVLFEKELLQGMKMWEGCHITSLIQRLGPATHTVPDSARGNIYIYMFDPASVPNANSPYPDIQRSRQRILSMKMMYYTRPDGKIYFTKISHHFKPNNRDTQYGH